MLHLQEMIELLVQFKIEKQKLTAILGDESTLMRRFYEGLVHNNFKNEDEAARALYGDKSTHSSGSFRTLKKDFKKRLHQLILMIDFSQDKSFNETQIAFYNNLKLLAVQKILSHRLKDEASLDVSKSIFEEASRFNFTESLISSARYLRSHH